MSWLHSLHIPLPAMLLIVSAAASAQQTQPDTASETRARVPALEAFHEVIFKVWHDAWPKKDTALLRTLLPRIEAGAREIAGASLPGILRDRKNAWDENIRGLDSAVTDYRRAVEQRAYQPLLSAAENLHSRYERLVRTIRPVLKELDQFHAVLYMLYHYYMPEKATGKIRESAAELSNRMKALNAAQLPPREAKKQEAFTAARAQLSDAVNALAAVAASSDEQNVREKILAVHAKYQALERVFE